MIDITIFDYGVGNLHSIKNGLERAGAGVKVTSDVDQILNAECVVLPGVGAFGKAMDAIDPIKADLLKRLNDGMPALGVCLGMQLLFERSSESTGGGIGFIKGDCPKLKLKMGKVPQIGWNSVQFLRDDELFVGIPQGSYFYFANSYVTRPTENVSIATTEYGTAFPSVIKKKNVYGTQFHPEKSDVVGLRMLANFVGFVGSC